MRTLASVIGLTVGLVAGASGAQAQAYLKGNDTGGIIAWSCDNEAAANHLAAAHCAWYGKYHRITSLQRQDGAYIGFQCLWEPGVARFAIPEVRIRAACPAQTQDVRRAARARARD
jgi:hypothetical protein